MTQPPSPSSEPASVRGLLRQNARPMLASAIATFAAILGVYAAARLSGAAETNCVLATMAVGTLWMAIAGPTICASARTISARLLLAGTVADVAGVCLLVVWLSGMAGQGPGLQFVAAVKIYCIFAVMVLAAAAAISLARSVVSRHVVALAAAIVLLLACSTPFWINGLIEQAAPESRQRIIAVAVESNPFYAVTAALVDQTRLVWHQSPVIYGITRIGEYNAPGPTDWYSFVLRCGAVGVFFAAAGLIRRAFFDRRPQSI
jgi:hypothetical protein